MSSQFITGLLLALPRLEGDSEIVVTTPLESRAYVELTRRVQREFGVTSAWLDGGQTLLFSNEDLKRLIIPLVIDQVLVRTVGMADTMMISSVGEAAISGVSLVDMINMLINAIFAAVATGGAVIASQYLGHRDREKACEASSQLMVVTAVCALVFTVLSLVARKPLLSLLFGCVIGFFGNISFQFFLGFEIFLFFRNRHWYWYFIWLFFLETIYYKSIIHIP